MDLEKAIVLSSSRTGKKTHIIKQELRKELFGTLSEVSMYNNFNAAVRNEYRLLPDQYVIICEVLQITPNELFGDETNGEAKQHLDECIEILQGLRNEHY